MDASAVLVTAVLAGASAALLTPWVRSVARSRSRWLARPATSLLAGTAGAGAAALASDWPELVGFALLGLGAALLVLLDLAVLRLPDVLVAPLYPLLLGPLAVAAALDGDPGRWVRAVGAGLLLAGVYLVLALVSPSQLGVGDVKLSGVLGAFLGWLGWPHLVLGGLAGFALSAGVSLVLLVVVRADRRTAFPFGPWMVLGAVLGAVAGPVVLPVLA
ncbi:prepilin peptidase [Desertihabitans brevis]|uniref:Prepilin peptidase n=1 Tax=Desertihabitans brevis TaxID=2268447 RepID=A0A367YTT4_9ACTN|nr:A24 family peptidase [Desertihabitans brevis]RCK69296.1 prepilin peptidase [Desertihabitans brevis]